MVNNRFGIFNAESHIVLSLQRRIAFVGSIDKVVKIGVPAQRNVLLNRCIVAECGVESVASHNVNGECTGASAAVVDG